MDVNKGELKLVPFYIEKITWSKCEGIFIKITEHRYFEDKNRNQLELNFLRKIGFLDQRFNASEIGLQYYTEKFIKNDKKRANIILSNILKNYKPVIVLCELLWGCKNLTKENLHRALLTYNLTYSKTSIEDITGFVMLLNQTGILSYSKKMNRIVINYNPISEKPERKEKIIAPSTPFTNIKHLRDIIRNSKEYLWWIDKHFGRKGLEPLIEELDGNKVKTINILLSINSSDNFEKLHTDFKRFKTELKNKGIDSSCRIIVDKDLINKIHGRWIISKSSCYKVPPLNSIFQGQFDELVKIDTKPNFHDWWKNSLDLLADWSELQKHLPKKS